MQVRSHEAVSAARATSSADGAQTENVIVIVGAGFCGTAVTIHLLRQTARAAPPGALRIVLVDPRGEIGAGVAYAARDSPYPLNVAAGQMSLDGATPHDFLDFVRGQGIEAQGGDYLPRQVYGDYLRTRFAQARAGAPANVECIHHRASALQLHRDGGHWSLWLDDGSALRAGDVVLATGNAPPACLPELAPPAASERYVRDPWSIGSGAHQDIGSVLLVGSGLTMIDAALRLAGR